MSRAEGEDLRGGEARLWKLIAERTREGADTAAIDRRIWDLFGERWAVVFTDLAGFSRRVSEFGIIHFLQVIHQQRQLLFPVIAAHDGILVKDESDSFLLLFRQPQHAMACAVEMQRVCQRHSRRRPPEEAVLLCVGVGYGDVLRIGDRDVWGAEVNAASKLGEDTAEANEILVTGAVYEACRENRALSFEQLAESPPGAERAFRVSYRVK